MWMGSLGISQMFPIFDMTFTILSCGFDTSSLNHKQQRHSRHHNDSQQQQLNKHQSNIQCVVGTSENALPYGQAQNPELSDYADDVDTMEFLLSL